MTKKYSLTKRLIRGTLSVGASITLISCAGNYGRLSPSDEVNQSFKNGVLKPGYEYCMTGSDASPDAILGAPKGTIESKFWNKRIEDEKTLKKKVKAMNAQASESTKTPYGADVLDNEGKDIGDWYSFTDRSIVRIKERGKFSVDTPDMGENRGQVFILHISQE